MTNRLEPAARTAEILAAALRVATTSGWATLRRDDIAREAGVSEGLVSARLGTMAQTRRAVMREAVRTACVPIVAEGLARRDTHACRASDALKAQAAAWVNQ